MELKQLRYFLVISECGNISAAAEKLHISQPALSLAVKKLEEELEVSLFKRTKNSIALNDNGKLVQKYAKQILLQTDKLKSEFLHSKNSLLSFGFCDPGPMRYAVPLFQKQYPHISVTSQLFPDDNENILLNQDIDAMISLNETESPDIVSEPFLQEELMLSVPARHRLAKQKSVCLHHEANLDLAYYCGEGAYIRRLEPFMNWLQSKFNFQKFDDYFLFRQTLEAQNLVTFTTKLVQNYRHDGENRVIIPLEDDGIKATYNLLYLRKNQKKLADFISFAKKLQA